MGGLIDLVTLLSDAGVSVVGEPSWATRSRPGPFKPVGVMVHHTAGGRTGDAPSLAVCRDGRPGLAGPLCHIVLARSGLAHVVSAGLANHAGPGDPRVLAAVRADAPVDVDARHRSVVPETAPGNASFWGIEVENTGLANDAEYPAVQLDALALICAALCHHHGWSANRVIHHRQWTRRKPDMSYRGDLRSAIEARMADLLVRDCPYGDA